MIRNTSMAYLTLLGGVYLMLFQVGERWWFSAGLTYLPRLPWLLPALILGGLAWKFHRRSILTNLLSAGVVLGPMMGLNLPLSRQPAGTSQSTLKVVTCNVQGFRPNFSQVLWEVSRSNPDLVAFQDARGESELLETFFQDWHTVRHQEFWVGSKYPVRLLAVCEVSSFDRVSAIAVEVELPNQRLRVVNVHLMTPREGLTGLMPGKTKTGSGAVLMEGMVALREEEAMLTRAFVTEMTAGNSHLVMGDLNMPVGSVLYEANWGDYRNAFNEAGWGYGYTFPTTGPGFWPRNSPWLRIDHILLSDDMQVSHCLVGSGAGSDHRMISATLHLQEKSRKSNSR